MQSWSYKTDHLLLVQILYQVQSIAWKIYVFVNVCFAGFICLCQIFMWTRKYLQRISNIHTFIHILLWNGWFSLRKETTNSNIRWIAILACTTSICKCQTKTVTIYANRNDVNILIRCFRIFNSVIVTII